MNLIRSLINISIITFLSRTLSFVRDFIVAYIFGVSISTDAFFIAFKIPNLLKRICAEGAFLQIIIPLLVGYKQKGKHHTTKYFFSCVLGFMIVTLFFMTLIGICLSAVIIFLTAPGFLKQPKEFALAVELLRITFPYVFFVSLSALTTAVLNIWGYFVIPVFSPILLNISMILFVVFLNKFFSMPILSLGWSVIFGGILQFLYQFLFLSKIDMFVMPKINFKILNISSLITKVGMGIIGVSANHISLFINGILASLFISGSVSWMYYADRLVEFPVGILGISLGTILLSLLTKSIAEKNMKEFSQLLDWGLRITIIIGIPSTIVIFILSRPIITVLFQYGKFTRFDTLMTEQSLLGYSIGLIAFILIKVLSPGFYARQDTKTPMIISIITIIVTQVLNTILFFVSLGQLGLSLSISFSSWLNVILLYWYLYKNKIFVPQSGWLRLFVKVIIASYILSVALFFILNIMPPWDTGSVIYKLFRLFLLFLFSTIVYLIALFILRFRWNQLNFKVSN
ncbi:murein biosynthesis integral membrane protein MurJ [Buchnera aphidicola]|uniref:Probable lipid II flippase MurJ n=1 Tax=Buchnera aphidicola (Stegophylla sp.) TaxID=2315800 RepID=A0A4D6Y979_9GAMM|nr:murein biosynthesis integral membrane protein MurJ [Buchnera aphidicola (Stegophylla sp.)]